MDDMSGGCTHKPITPVKETKTGDFTKLKTKKFSKLKNQPNDDFQLDMTNRYDSLSPTDSDKDTDQPEPKKKRKKMATANPKNKEKIHSKNSQDKLVTETSNIDNETTTTRIPKYMTAILDHFHPAGNQSPNHHTQAYNTAKDALKKQNFNFYTFTPKEEKSHSAILKGLPASIDIIKQELTEHHIHLQYIEQFTPKTGQGPERTIRKHGIFNVLQEINVINRTTVNWEEYQPRNDDIPQCANCQGWGYTKNNCAWQARCIKSKQEKPEEHQHTKYCLKHATIPAHCVNCKGQHPANYRHTTNRNPITQHNSPNHTSTPTSAHSPTTITQKFKYTSPTKHTITQLKQTTHKQSVTSTINDIKELLDFLRDPLIMDMLTHFRQYMEQTRLVIDKGRRKHTELEVISTFLAQDYD
ncbi:hypothetical protein PR048_002631 [Dryococelus australis]|uniref:Polyprotein n=1 Tax=Dryococelus australis TaxID=614101 RepID=A0ABQ9IKS1_9NEOP|nr:hypothetical protein PR048_002631 [Dryococelus australis]